MDKFHETSQTARMSRIYRRQAAIFGISRLPMLLGRRRLASAVRPGDQVLEIGCGTGSNLRRLARAAGPTGNVVGFECAPTMAARARARHSASGMAPILVREAEFPVAGDALGQFDLVVFSYSLSMMPDWPGVMDAAWRALRPGGRISMLDFTAAPWPWLHRRIEACGVRLDPRIADSPASRFDLKPTKPRRAWGGLWSYVWVQGQRRSAPG